MGTLFIYIRSSHSSKPDGNNSIVSSSGSEESEELGRDERKDIGKNVGEEEGEEAGNGEAMEECEELPGGEGEDEGKDECDRHGRVIASEEHGSPNVSEEHGSPNAGDRHTAAKSPTLSENSPDLITVHACNKNGPESANKGPPQSFCVTYIYKQNNNRFSPRHHG